MCFSLDWVMHLCIWAVIIIALIAILRLFVPWLLSQLGGGGAMIGQIINIVIWAFVCIIVIYIVFSLISCLLSMGGGFSLSPRRSDIDQQIQNFLAWMPQIPLLHLPLR